MPYKDREQRRAAEAKYRSANVEKVKARKKKWRDKNKTTIRAKIKKWNTDNADRVRTKQKEWAQSNPDKIREYQRSSARKKMYGIDREAYNRKLAEQGGVCAICKQPERVIINGRRINLAVDHDHLTDEIRDLLCSSCNGALGLVKDSIAWLEAMIEYLKKHQPEWR